MNARLIADWILGASKEMQEIFNVALAACFSNVQMADRIVNLAAQKHFQSCPWQVGVHLINPEKVDWCEVRRLIAEQKGMAEPTRESELPN